MPGKSNEYKFRTSISTEMGESASKELNDKNFGKGIGESRFNSRKTFASISIGFDNVKDYAKDMEILMSEEFVNALEKHRTTTQSVCKFAFKNDLIITIEKPENPYEAEPPATPPADTPTPTEEPQPQLQAQTPLTVVDLLKAANFAESQHNKPSFIKERYFRTTKDAQGNKTGYVNVELTKDGWRMNRWIKATGETIQYDPGWPEEYVNLMSEIDKIVAAQKLGF